MVEASLELLVLPKQSKCWDYRLGAVHSAEVSLAAVCCLLEGAHALLSLGAEGQSLEN